MTDKADILYQPYQALTAGQRKLLCFLAYTGKKTDEQIRALYRHGEDLKVDQMKKLVNGLRSFYETSFYSYRNEYQLHAHHVAPLMLYLLEVMPQWLWWNPAIEQQATDRAYRIGQRQNVTVYHLTSQHTIEEKILRLHQTKRNLADAMLEGTNESHKLTSKDLLAMIDKDS